MAEEAANPAVVAAAVFGLDDEEAAEWDDRFRMLARAGRNRSPALVSAWWDSGELDVKLLRALIGDAWDAPEYPVAALGERRWLELWRAAGFVSQSGVSPSTEPLTVYRGAPLRTRGRGMSWSLDRDTARWFASRWADCYRVDAGLFTVVAPPHAVLAILDDTMGRNEAEVVLNPRCLRGRATPELVETLPRGDHSSP